MPLLVAATAFFLFLLDTTGAMEQLGTDVNAKDGEGCTPQNWAESKGHKENADLLRKHGGKTGKELKAEGK